MTILLFLLIAAFGPLLVFFPLVGHHRKQGAGPFEALSLAALTTSKVGALLVVLGCVGAGLWAQRLNAALLIGVGGGITAFLGFQITSRILVRLAPKLDSRLAKLDTLVEEHLPLSGDGRDPYGLEHDDDASNLKILLFIVYSVVLFGLTTPQEHPRADAPLVMQVVGCASASMVLVWTTWRIIPKRLKAFSVLATMAWPVTLLVLLYLASMLGG